MYIVISKKRCDGSQPRPHLARSPRELRNLLFDKNELERETGIEPATNSLGSCDSTPELLPLSPADFTSLTLRQNRPQFIESPPASHVKRKRPDAAMSDNW